MNPHNMPKHLTCPACAGFGARDGGNGFGVVCETCGGDRRVRKITQSN